MTHKCRFPGCTAEMQTEHGREMHEQMCHTFTQLWMAEEVFTQVQAQSGLADVDVPLEDQLAYNQDIIVIEEAVDSMKHSSCS